MIMSIAPRREIDVKRGCTREPTLFHLLRRHLSQQLVSDRFPVQSNKHVLKDGVKKRMAKALILEGAVFTVRKTVVRRIEKFIPFYY